ncbi:DUF4129 domain-containing protein [Herbiconiux moechotypicola]|uniref:Protein-glutamine gamma-glutamyltransferase-like C-terminal domain-containing protein n=1 Tax=Herbiconiux moechotypicola TaxID=637393 RepID=A0ABN3DUE8_9MICO|nr:DUF4129 domain-containing protein [Herbiconiux moechotypicola]MCS5731045.1 DUF4129 domain-containing protein [Herbiconiux moechotypicola]
MIAPVEPGADEAREWLLGELSKPPYQAARPTWFDLVSQAIGDWIASLRVPDGSGLGGLLPVIAVAVVVVLLVIAVIVFGRPRLNRRSAVAPGSLFGDDDTRSSAELRASAERAAAAGDFGTAVQEAFRALARRLAERTVVMTGPGSTAQDFAARAGRSFPPRADELRACAALFDGVRYLDRPGTRDGYERVHALDRLLDAERPVALDAVAPQTVSAGRA